MTENDPFTAKSEDGAETRIIEHTNGDRTIVPGSVDDDTAAQLSQLSGADVAAAIAAKQAEDEAEKERVARERATQVVLDDPPAATTVSTNPLAGPDPVRQGGTSSDGEGGAGAVFPTTVPAPGFSDAETVKAQEAADPTGGVDQADDDGPSDSRTQEQREADELRDSEPRTTGPNI